MRFTKSLVACVAILLFVFTPGLRAQQVASSPGDQNVWAMNALKEMQTVQVGMTRSDLEKVFMIDGGGSTRKSQTYVYRKCIYLKVDVEYAPVEMADGRWEEAAHDKIVKISKPYLDNPILD